MDKQEQIQIKRHSLSHILASAVLEMFPEAKLAIGPAIEDGFYYDFDLPRTLILEDLPILEEKMRKIIEQNLPFERAELGIDEAADIFSKVGQDYKIELIKDMKAQHYNKVSIYRTGHFTDLCAGPHIDSTAEIDPKSFKLTKTAGAYWKGDEKNKMLQRIYAVAFETKKELDEYLKMREEAEKRDHRKLGKELDLFSFHPEAPGIPFFHPKGTIIYHELKNFWIEAQKEFDYDTVLCPTMLDVAIWKKSGHWDHYKDDMYFIKSDDGEREFALRPMDCPGAILIYNNSMKSYKDLPLRYSEPGLITRKEKSGQLGGLMRVQQFIQDDAHIFITEDQIEDEIKKVIALVDKIYKPFGLEYKAYLSTRPDDYMGDLKAWNKAENELTKILKKVYGDNFGLKEKDGAFYGPKIDYQLKDCLGRTWQCATIQLDFQMPLKFDCKYIDKDGKEKNPVLIHRTIMGSFERFMGILIEHFAGAFPTWLSPEQAHILPVSEKHKSYAQEVINRMREKEIRIMIKGEDETLGKRIRESEKSKVPYMLIVGDKEVESKSVTVRSRGEKEQKTVGTSEFIEDILKEIKDKRN